MARLRFFWFVSNRTLHDILGRRQWDFGIEAQLTIFDRCLAFQLYSPIDRRLPDKIYHHQGKKGADSNLRAMDYHSLILDS